MTIVVVIGAIVVLAVLLLILSIKVVPEYRRIVLFRLGRMVGLRGPGIVIIIPLVDRAIFVDLREFYIEIPHQSAITRDNATISIDFITFFRVVDPTMSIVAVATFEEPRRTLLPPRCGRSSATSRSTMCSRNATRSTPCCATSSTKSPSGGASK